MSYKNKLIISNINDKYKSFKRLKRIDNDLKKGCHTPSAYLKKIIEYKKKELFKMLCIQKNLLKELMLLIFSPIKTDTDDIAIESCIDDLVQLMTGQSKKKFQIIASAVVYPSNIIYRMEIFYYDVSFKKFCLYITFVK